MVLSLKESGWKCDGVSLLCGGVGSSTEGSGGTPTVFSERYDAAMVSVVSGNAPFVGVGLLRPLVEGDGALVDDLFARAVVHVGCLDVGDAELFVADAVRRWGRHKTGIGVLSLPGSDEPCGLAGLQMDEGADGEPELRLHMVATEQLAEVRALKQVVRELVRWAARYAPSARVRCTVDASDEVALDALRGAGLCPVDAGALGGGGSEHLVLELPHLQVVRDADDVPVDAVLDVWCAVNNAGGAVGFLPGAPRDQVRRKLDGHLESMRRGESVFTMLCEPLGGLLGVAWWERLAPNRWGPDRSHVAKLFRFMVHPEHQKQGLGDVFLCGGHSVVDAMGGVRFAYLDYRDGAGVGEFYGRHGYVEVGRYPDLLACRESDGSVILRDGVTMRRVVGES